MATADRKRSESRSEGASARAQSYALRPDPDAAAKLDMFCAGARWWWNQAIEHQRARRRAGEKLETRVSMAYAVKAARDAGVTFPWHGAQVPLAEVPSVMLHGALLELDLSYKLFFSNVKAGRRASPPSFRSAVRGAQSVRWQVQAGSGPAPWRKVLRRRSTGSVNWWEARIPGVGWAPVRLHRPLPDDALVGYMIAARDEAGDWTLTAQYEALLAEREPTGAVVGVDRGVAVTLATSDGREFRMPGLTTGRQVRKRRLEQSMARSRRVNACPTEVWRQIDGRMRLIHRCDCPRPGPGEQPACWHHSRRREHTRAAHARLARHEARQRKDAAHKASRALANDYDIVAFEDLKLRNMTRSAKGDETAPGRNVRAKSGLNREMLGNGLGLIAALTAYKTSVVKVDARHTSQTCPECGHVDPANRRRREFLCAACGHAAHADVVGGLNALRRAVSDGLVVAPAGAQSVAGRGDLSALAGQEVGESSTTTQPPTGCERSGGGSDPGERSHPDHTADMSPMGLALLVPVSWGVGTARRWSGRRRSRPPTSASGRNGRRSR